MLEALQKTGAQQSKHVHLAHISVEKQCSGTQKRVLCERPLMHQMYPGLLAQVFRLSVVLLCLIVLMMVMWSHGMGGLKVGMFKITQFSTVSFTSILRESVSMTIFPTLQHGDFTTTSKRCI